MRLTPPPSFAARYVRLKEIEADGSLTGADPFPEDLEAAWADAEAAEEKRLGRPLTPEEKAALRKDDDE